MRYTLRNGYVLTVGRSLVQNVKVVHIMQILLDAFSFTSLFQYVKDLKAPLRLATFERYTVCMTLHRFFS